MMMVSLVSFLLYREDLRFERGGDERARGVRCCHVISGWILFFGVLYILRLT